MTGVTIMIMKKKIIATNPIRNEEIRKRMMSAASSSIAEVFRNFNTGENGLSEAEAERSREKYGDNTITRKKSDSMLHLSPLPLIFFGILALTVLCYMALVTAVKKLYVARYGELL